MTKPNIFEVLRTGTEEEFQSAWKEYIRIADEEWWAEKGVRVVKVAEAIPFGALVTIDENGKVKRAA